MNSNTLAQDLGRRRRIALGIAGAVFVAGVLVTTLAGNDASSPILDGAMFVVFMGSVFWYASFRCPRCRKLFFFGADGWWVNPLRSRCGACGLSSAPEDE